MTKLTENLEKLVNSIQKEKGIIAMYLYGSYVNGYFRDDSDIDLVAVTKNKASQKAEKRNYKVEVHYVIKDHIEYYEIGRSYASLNMVPVFNEGYVNSLSSKIKKELVCRGVKRLAKKQPSEKPEVDILFPIRNFLLRYATERPWRIKPIKRIFSSQESQKLLREAYFPVFEDLLNDGLFLKEENNFYLNPNFHFSNDIEKRDSALLNRFLSNLKGSLFGYHHLTNLLTILKYKQQAV